MIIIHILHFHDCKGVIFVKILEKLEQLDLFLRRMWSDDPKNFERNVKIGTLMLKIYQIYHAISTGDRIDADKIDEIRITVVD